MLLGNYPKLGTYLHSYRNLDNHIKRSAQKSRRKNNHKEKNYLWFKKLDSDSGKFKRVILNRP